MSDLPEIPRDALNSTLDDLRLQIIELNRDQ